MRDGVIMDAAPIALLNYLLFDRRRGEMEQLLRSLGFIPDSC